MQSNQSSLERRSVGHWRKRIIRYSPLVGGFAVLAAGVASAGGEAGKKTSVPFTAGRGAAAGPEGRRTPMATPPRGGSASAVAAVPNVFTPAPSLGAVSVSPNRDSVVLGVPAVPGVRDYRVFAIPAGVTVSAIGDRERIVGGTVYCAGVRQRSAPLSQSPVEVMRQIEVEGLRGPTELVVEAIDAQCPFSGSLARTHRNLELSPTAQRDPRAGKTWDLFTEDEARATFGSLFIRGQAGGPLLASPGDPTPPRVLARASVLATPVGNGPPPTAFFDDFSDDGDQPRFVTALEPKGRSQRGALFQNSKFSFYTYGTEGLFDARRKTQDTMLIERGILRTVLPDVAQEIFGTNFMLPRRPVELSDADYVHATFEVASDASARRYWWFFVCGAGQRGATMSTDGHLKSEIIQDPFFYQDDGENPSMAGWNCLQVFQRDGGYYPLPMGGTKPESDIRVMINRPGNYGPENRDNVVNVSPAQYGDALEPSWYRPQSGNQKFTGAMLDDQLVMAPRTHFDFYIRRDRFILFANGKQKICNDFPKARLTMAEGAMGLGHVLYHSSAEHGEFSRDDWDRTGQREYISNTPWADTRTWDNVGYEEHAPPPAGFVASSCYVSDRH